MKRVMGILLLGVLIYCAGCYSHNVEGGYETGDGCIYKYIGYVVGYTDAESGSIIETAEEFYYVANYVGYVKKGEPAYIKYSKNSSFPVFLHKEEVPEEVLSKLHAEEAR